MRKAGVVLGVLSGALVVACGINPVTGKKEIQFITEAQEVQIGQQNYAPAQQSEGGDFDELPDLTAYVNEIGQKLAAVSDRKLPYEFVVLNNSVPNAWALPGGKIAVNRSLLTELNNESELAAVLGHEIVHAAARHGAKAQERGTLMQAGLAVAQVGAAVGGVDQTVGGLLIGGASLGAQLVQTKYGRDQELEADHYGMKYMKAAGYDPTGAVTLQETFVRLAEKEGREQGWFEGLFASHPPSAERVVKNKEMLAQLGAGGVLGKEQYVARIAPLKKIEPAYDKFHDAELAFAKKDYATAKKLTNEASQLVPREGRFYQMLGDIEMAQKHYSDALPHYAKAIDLNGDYFGSYLGAGVAELEKGNREKAEEWLTTSARLLPTAPAAYYLASIAKEKGDQTAALNYYKAAAGSNSEYGRLANAELIRLDLPRNPGNYIATGAQLDARGRVILIVENRSPVALSGIQVTPVLVDATGRIVREGSTIAIREVVNPNQRISGDAGIGTVSPDQLPYVKFRVDGARVAEQ
jgi:beta-barrel assembly-enhancing protease